VARLDAIEFGENLSENATQKFWDDGELLEEGDVRLEQWCCGKLAAIAVFVMGLVMVASMCLCRFTACIYYTDGTKCFWWS